MLGDIFREKHRDQRWKDISSYVRIRFLFLPNIGIHENKSNTVGAL